MTTPDDSADDIAERIASSVRDQLERSDDSRRSFLGKTALAGGGLFALGSGVGLTVADSTPSHMEEANFDDVEGTDLDVLNYALTLEQLESAFYRMGTEQFSESDFQESDALADFSEDVRTNAYHLVQTAGKQEDTHVEVLTDAVDFLGGTPVEAGEYEFGIDAVDEFIGTGAVLENVGVSAYRGAAPFIESPDLLGVALSIHSVEARHAAVFNYLSGEQPYPNAFDPARSQDEVLEAAASFLGGDNGTDGNGTDGNGTDGNMTTTDGEPTTTNGTDTGTGTGTETGTEIQ